MHSLQIRSRNQPSFIAYTAAHGIIQRVTIFMWHGMWHQYVECRSALQGAAPFVTKNNIATLRYALKLLSL